MSASTAIIADPMRLPGGISPHNTPDGRLRHRVRYPIAGKRESIGLYDTLGEAEEALAAAREKYGKSAGLTLRAWAPRWLEAREIEGLHRTDVTSIWKARISRARFASWPLVRIKRTDIVRWVKEQLKAAPHRGHRHQTAPDRKTGRQTVVNALNVLRVMLRAAADEGHIPTSPAEGVRVPKVPTTEEGWTYLEVDEIERLTAPIDVAKLTERIAEHRIMQRVVFIVAIYTGLREGELWGLRWCDVHIDGARPELVVRHSYRGPTKGGRVRRVPLLPRAIEALAEWKRKQAAVGAALVWPAPKARHDDGLQHCHAKGYDAGFGAALTRVSITRDVRFHDLRHTCGSHLVMGSWGLRLSLEDVRQWLGHKSIKTTERYCHLSSDGILATVSKLHTESAKGHEQNG